jgi:hypothetical protein
MNKNNGFGAGTLLAIGALALGAGCFLGFGLSLLWPRNNSTSPTVVTQMVVVTATPNNDASVALVESTPISLPATEPTQTPNLLLGNTRDNPVPYGEKSEVDTGLTLVITDVMRPADSFVSVLNQFNSTPTPDKEYIRVTAIFTCNKSSNEKCSYFAWDLQVVGQDGNVIDNEFLVDDPDEFEVSGELFGGASKQGTIYYIVTKGDNNIVLYYDPFLGIPTYFAIN